MSAETSIEVDLGDPDNPEWTAEDFQRALPPSALPPALLAAFPRTGIAEGSGATSPKRQVTLRLDADVLDAYRASGAGWQTRINAALRRSLAAD